MSFSAPGYGYHVFGCHVSLKSSGLLEFLSLFLVFDDLDSFQKVLVSYFVDAVNLSFSDVLLMVRFVITGFGEEDHREVPLIRSYQRYKNDLLLMMLLL